MEERTAIQYRLPCTQNQGEVSDRKPLEESRVTACCFECITMERWVNRLIPQVPEVLLPVSGLIVAFSLKSLMKRSTYATYLCDLC